MTVIKSYFSLFQNNIINEFSTIAPSPQRDFHQFLITTSKFIWRWWKITARNDGAKFHPCEIVNSHEDFLHDERLHGEIRRVFDRETLQYAIKIAEGSYDILPRLPRNILTHVFYYMNLEDIINLGYTSKSMYRICNDESLWQELYHRYNHSSSPTVVADLAETFGWKRVFFTNKLQLQMQLRRIKNNRSANGSRPVDEINDETVAEAELPLDSKQNNQQQMKPSSPVIQPIQDTLIPCDPILPHRYATSTIAGAEDWNDLESEFLERSFFEDTEEEELKKLNYD